MGGAAPLLARQVVITKRQLPFVIALTAVVLGAVVALTLLVRDDHASTIGLPVGDDGIAVRASLGSRTQLFGQLLAVRLDLLVDREMLDPDKITVDTRFDPFTMRGAPVKSRRDYDRFTRLRYEYRLDCVTTICVPEGARKDFDLPSAPVRHEGVPVEIVEWPPVTIASRYREPEPDQGIRFQGSVDLPWRANVRVHPASYSVDPTLLTVALAALALLLMLVSLFFVQRAFPSAPFGFRRLRRTKLTPLERAIAVLERAQKQGIEREQRLALDRLARELRTGGQHELAGTARELAWIAEVPGPDRTATLSERVRAVIAEGTNGRS
jgi:hypothetical protein